MYKIKVFLATGAALATTVFSSFANLADDLTTTLTHWKATVEGIDQLNSFEQENFDYTNPRLMAEEIVRLSTQGIEWTNMYVPNALEFIQLSYALRMSETTAASGKVFFAPGSIDFEQFLTLQTTNAPAPFGNALMTEKIEALGGSLEPEIRNVVIQTESHSTTGNFYFDVNALSTATSPIEVVIFFNGGGWMSGSEVASHLPQITLIEELTQAGKIVLHAYYRSLPRTIDPSNTTQISDVMADIYCATEWLYNYINTQTLTLGEKELTFQKKITAFGFSAGGHLALASAQFKNDSGENMVNKVFAWTPATDIRLLLKAGIHHHPVVDREMWFTAVDSEYDPALVPPNSFRPDLVSWNENTRPFATYSPLQQISEVDPDTKILMFNIANDTVATPLQAFKYYDAATALGIDVQSIYATTGKHNSFNQEDVIFTPQVRDFLQF